LFSDKKLQEWGEESFSNAMLILVDLQENYREYLESISPISNRIIRNIRKRIEEALDNREKIVVILEEVPTQPLISLGLSTTSTFRKSPRSSGFQEIQHLISPNEEITLGGMMREFCVKDLWIDLKKHHLKVEDIDPKITIPCFLLEQEKSLISSEEHKFFQKSRKLFFSAMV